jgi:hypothetical protein
MPNVHQPEFLRIAMWSGPRNISTAMMRSWGNRPDTIVVDEPLYAYYLKATGKDHPMAREIIAAGETDWRKVVTDLTESRHKGPSQISPRKDGSHITPQVFLSKAYDPPSLAGDGAQLARGPDELLSSFAIRRR